MPRTARDDERGRAPLGRMTLPGAGRADQAQQGPGDTVDAGHPDGAGDALPRSRRLRVWGGLALAALVVLSIVLAIVSFLATAVLGAHYGWVAVFLHYLWVPAGLLVTFAIAACGVVVGVLFWLPGKTSARPRVGVSAATDAGGSSRARDRVRGTLILVSGLCTAAVIWFLFLDPVMSDIPYLSDPPQVEGVAYSVEVVEYIDDPDDYRLTVVEDDGSVLYFPDVGESLYDQYEDRIGPDAPRDSTGEQAVVPVRVTYLPGSMTLISMEEV